MWQLYRKLHVTGTCSLVHVYSIQYILYTVYTVYTVYSVYCTLVYSVDSSVVQKYQSINLYLLIMPGT